MFVLSTFIIAEFFVVTPRSIYMPRNATQHTDKKEKSLQMPGGKCGDVGVHMEYSGRM